MRMIAAVLFLFCVALPASAKERPGDDLLAVTFTGARDGWACGRWGTVLHTADGGQTWTHQKTGVDFTLTSIHFADARNGWAVGDEGTILHTADGGATWETQKSPVPYYLMGVFFADSRRGWIVTERTTVLHTDDGGQTWAVQWSGEDFILKAVALPDGVNGWAVGEYGFIYRTEDGGKTWKKQAGEFHFSDETGEVVGGHYLFGLAAVDAKTAWAVGIEGYTVRTADGGKTWQQVSGLPKVHLFGVAAAGAGSAVVVGDATLLTTQDGGKTWTAPDVAPPVTYGWLYAVTRRGAEGYAAAGLEGRIYHADSAARTWRLARKQ